MLLDVPILPIFSYKDAPPLEFGVIKLLDGLQSLFRLRELHNPPASRVPICIVHDLGENDISNLPEMVFQILPRSFPSKIAYKAPAAYLKFFLFSHGGLL